MKDLQLPMKKEEHNHFESKRRPSMPFKLSMQ